MKARIATSSLDGVKVQRSDEGVDFVKFYSVPIGSLSGRSCALYVFKIHTGYVN